MKNQKPGHTGKENPMRRFVTWVAVVMVLGLVGSAFAQDEEGTAKKKRERKTKAPVEKKMAAGPRAMGAVKSVDVDGGKLVVAVRKRGEKDPVEQTYTINAETKVTEGTEAKALNHLAEGKMVVIAYTEAAEGGTPVATLITMRAPMTFGTVKSTDAKAKTLTVTTMARGKQAGEDVTFQLADDTKVTSGRDAKTLADLAEGTRVTVQYKEAARAKTALAVRMMTPQQPREGGERKVERKREKKNTDNEE